MTSEPMAASRRGHVLGASFVRTRCDIVRNSLLSDVVGAAGAGAAASDRGPRRARRASRGCGVRLYLTSRTIDTPSRRHLTPLLSSSSTLRILELVEYVSMCRALLSVPLVAAPGISTTGTGCNERVGPLPRRHSMRAAPRPHPGFSIWKPNPVYVPAAPADRVVHGVPKGGSFATPPPGGVPPPGPKPRPRPQWVPNRPRPAGPDRSLPTYSRRAREEHRASGFLDSLFHAPLSPRMEAWVSDEVQRVTVRPQSARSPPTGWARSHSPYSWASQQLPPQPGSLAASLLGDPEPTLTRNVEPEPEPAPPPRFQDPFEWIEGPFLPVDLYGRAMLRTPKGWPRERRSPREHEPMTRATVAERMGAVRPRSARH